MWIITHIHTGNKSYLISEAKKYVVGRVGSDIVLSDDTSISRSHAVFHVTNASLKLEDTGSKYGTYYNENIESKTKLPKGKPIELKEGDRVLFGALKNEWLISRSNITTMVSSLNATQISEVKGLLNILGGKIISKWEPSCTHLTMSEITITIKVLHALIEKIPIVSCEYWKEYLKDLRETKQPPKASLYLPKRSAFLSSAIDVAHFNFNEKRKTLFAGKTFVFMSKKHLDMYSPIVLKAGGECKDLNSNVHKSYLRQKNVIVVQYVASTQSQGSQTINTISEYLETSALRTVPEYEIGLAIVCCTTEKYCNPSYNAVSNILPNSTNTSPNIGTMLAEGTCSQKSQFNTLELSMVEIPDSVCSSSKSAPSRPLHSEIYEKSQTESDVITIENSENSENSDEYISQIPESSASNENKRKRYESDKNEDEKRTSKKINISSQDAFSENLVISSDMISYENEVLTPTEQSKPKSNRKRQTTCIESEMQIAKKAHTSTLADENTDEISNEHFNAPSNTSEVVSITTKKTAQPKRAENKTNAYKPLPVNAEVSKKQNPQSKTRFSGYLQKSQIVPLQQEVQAPKTSGLTKRGRIALITDNDSNNEDDIFNFGSSPKKSRASGYNSDEEVFAFGRNQSEDTVDRAENKNEEVLSPTQASIPIKKLNSKVVLHNIKVAPLKVASEGWLSKLNLLKIEDNKEPEPKNENDPEDLKRSEWIDSIKGGFEVRVRKMNLPSRRSNCSTVQDSSSNSTLGTTKKNFKAFVKKQNYKPQTLIVRTVPMVVPPMH